MSKLERSSQGQSGTTRKQRKCSENCSEKLRKLTECVKGLSQECRDTAGKVKSTVATNLAAIKNSLASKARQVSRNVRQFKEEVVPHKPARSVQVQSSEDQGERGAIPPNAELLDELQRAVLEHRKIKRRNDEYDEELGQLYDKLEVIDESIGSLHARTDAPFLYLDAETAEGIKNELARKAVEREEVVAELDQSKRRMWMVYEDHVKDQSAMFEMLDALFVGKKMLEPHIQPGSRRTSISSASTVSEKSSASEYQASIPTEIGQTYLTYSTSVPSVCNQETPAEEAVEEACPDQERHLLLTQRFRMACYRLDAAEKSLENMALDSDREDAARLVKIAAGEDVPPQFEYDLEHLKWVQRLTRDVMEAEAEYANAKAEAVAAGICLQDYEVTSGFVDDPEDGELISYERDLATKADYTGIRRWIDLVDDVEGISSGPIGAEELHDVPISPTEVDADDWDARSVDMWESMSVVAVGADRRHIDKWRALRGF